MKIYLLAFVGILISFFVYRKFYPDDTNDMSLLTDKSKILNPNTKADLNQIEGRDLEARHFGLQKLVAEYEKQNITSTHALYALYEATESLKEHEEALVILDELIKILPNNKILHTNAENTKINLRNAILYARELEGEIINNQNPNLILVNWKKIIHVHPKPTEESKRKFKFFVDKIKELKKSSNFKENLNKIKTLVCIETGQIEGLYTLSKEVTQELVEFGIDGDLILHHEFNKSPTDLVAATKAYTIASIIEDNQKVFSEIESILYKNQPITVELIKQLQMLFTYTARYSQHPKEGTKLIRRGKFKLRPNAINSQALKKVIIFTPPSEVEIALEMMIRELKDLENKLNGPETAAWLHTTFINSHPFDDGNGRVARALVTIILGRDNLLPFTVQPEKVSKYHAALNEMTNGNFEPFVNFIFEQQEYLLLMFEKVNK